MPRSVSPVRAGILLFGVLLLLGLPSLPAAGSAPPPASGSAALVSLVAPSVSALPAALQTSWAERSGFLAAPSGGVANPTRSTGIVAVSVTLWPASNALFSTPPAGAPPLASAAVAGRYGATAANYASLEAYFESKGLAITHTWPDRLSLGVSGPAAAVDSAFGTTLESGIWQGRPVRFPSTLPHLPAPFADEVAAISGLSDGFTRFSIPFSSAPLPAGAALPAAVRTSTLITPSSVHQIYDLNGLYNYSGTPHWATGVGIALVLWGDGYAPGDIQSFYGSYYPAGFPSILVQGFPVDGAPAPSASAVNDPSGAAQELTLDLEWSGSQAPGATLDAVYAPDGPASNNYSPSDPTMEDALSTAVNLAGVKVISMSFGTPDGTDPSFQAAFAVSFASATQRGITVLAASGDNGGTAQSNCQGGASPQFPAASPQVLAVGGTAPVLALSAIGQVTGLADEPAWNLSGGGFSSDYSAPSWQEVGSASSPIASNGHRGIPDVAGPAADNFFFFGGNPAAGKGTSFATPMWAGMIAEMDALRGTPLGFVTPRLYRVGASEETGTAALGLVDVTQGSTCLGAAGTGWDEATGWGSPRALLLYQDLLFSYVDLNLTTTSAEVAPGGSVDAVVQVLNSTSHRPIPNLPVVFTLDALGSIGICTGNLAVGNATTDATGRATLSLPVPGCYFGSHIGLTATVSSRGYFGSNSTTLTVNLLGLAGFLSGIQVYPYNVIAFVLIMGGATATGLLIGSWRHRRHLQRLAAQRPVVRRPPTSQGAAPSVAPGGPPGPPQPPPSPPPIAGPLLAPPPPPPEPTPVSPPPLPTPIAEPQEPREPPAPLEPPEPQDVGALDAPAAPPGVPDHVLETPAWTDDAPEWIPPSAGVAEEVAVPAHVAEAPPSLEAPAGSAERSAPEPEGAACRVCGTALSPSSDLCPTCGASRGSGDGEGPDPSAEVHEPGPGG